MKRIVSVLVVVFLWVLLGNVSILAEETVDQTPAETIDVNEDPIHDAQGDIQEAEQTNEDPVLDVQQMQESQQTSAERYIENTQFSEDSIVLTEEMDPEITSIEFVINKVDERGNPVEGAEFEIFYEQDLSGGYYPYGVTSLAGKFSPYTFMSYENEPAPEFYITDNRGMAGRRASYTGYDNLGNEERYMIFTEQLYYKDGSPKLGTEEDSLLFEDYDLSLSEWKVYSYPLSIASEIYRSLFTGINLTLGESYEKTDEELVEYKKDFLKNNYVGTANFLGMSYSSISYSFNKSAGVVTTDKNGNASVTIPSYYLKTISFVESGLHSNGNYYSADGSIVYVYSPYKSSMIKIVETKVPEGYTAQQTEYSADLFDGSITIINYKEPETPKETPSKPEEKKEVKKEEPKEETTKKVVPIVLPEVQTSVSLSMLGYALSSLISLAGVSILRKH